MKTRIILLLLLSFGLVSAERQKIRSYRDLIESLYKLDPQEVHSQLSTLQPMSIESKNKLLRIIDSIIIQEEYKKKRIKKGSLAYMLGGTAIAFGCLFYLYQN